METAKNNTELKLIPLNNILDEFDKYILKLSNNDCSSEELESFVNKYSYIKEKTCVLPFMQRRVVKVIEFIEIIEDILDIMNSPSSENIEHLQKNLENKITLFRQSLQKKIEFSDEEKHLIKKQNIIEKNIIIEEAVMLGRKQTHITNQVETAIRYCQEKLNISHDNPVDMIQIYYLLNDTIKRENASDDHLMPQIKNEIKQEVINPSSTHSVSQIENEVVAKNN